MKLDVTAQAQQIWEALDLGPWPNLPVSIMRPPAYWLTKWLPLEIGPFCGYYFNLGYYTSRIPGNREGVTIFSNNKPEAIRISAASHRPLVVLIHELTHVYLGEEHYHDNVFKRTEDQLIRRFLALTPVQLCAIDLPREWIDFLVVKHENGGTA